MTAVNTSKINFQKVKEAFFGVVAFIRAENTGFPNTQKNAVTTAMTEAIAIVNTGLLIFRTDIL